MWHYSNYQLGMLSLVHIGITWNALITTTVFFPPCILIVKSENFLLFNIFPVRLAKLLSRSMEKHSQPWYYTQKAVFLSLFVTEKTFLMLYVWVSAVKNNPQRAHQGNQKYNIIRQLLPIVQARIVDHTLRWRTCRECHVSGMSRVAVPIAPFCHVDWKRQGASDVTSCFQFL